MKSDKKKLGPTSNILSIERICAKYVIPLPKVFVTNMDTKYINEAGEFGDFPDPKKELGVVLGAIESTNERIIYLKTLLKKCDIELFIQPLNEQLTQLENIAKRELNKISTSKKVNDESSVQVGRPPDFDPQEIKSLFNALKIKSKFQHQNGKPHKTNIREEIREQLTRKEDGQIIKPSMKTIKRHS